MNQPAAFEAEGLHKHFGQVQALADVSLRVKQGQIFGVLGPNGAGKTTLIRVLTGSARPTSGRVSVLGFDPWLERRAVRERIGYMPQEPALYEDLSARENVHFFGAAHQVERLGRRVAEVLDFVGLQARAADPVYTFSGGMKQRVSLACALVHRPQMLFLDEPTSGIDPQLRETFWRHFRELASEGVTVIVSTHQMDEATQCARLAILHRGTLLANDAPRELLLNSSTRVRMWRDNDVDEYEVTDYPRQLPVLLQAYGLRPEVSRLEIEGENLEAVVLRLIGEREDLGQQERDHD